jgi:hypothetical protein
LPNKVLIAKQSVLAGILVVELGTSTTNILGR